MGVLKYFFTGLVFCGSLWAMPALDHYFPLQQPDGSSLHIRSVGNEVLNFKVTEDGYVVARDSLGFFSYLGEDGFISGVHAHEIAQRSAQELEFLNSLNKEAVLNAVRNRGESRTYGTIHKAEGSFESTDSGVPAIRYMPKPNVLANDGEKKALVILVQFSDVKFKSSDPKAQFESYLNEDGYNVNGNLGSVKEYFRENSSGKFVPNYEVVGPITLSGPAYKTYGNYSVYGQMGGAVALMEALDTLISRQAVDFTQYDSNKDGFVDFVHMIYAGIGSNDSKQDSAVWPHMWYLSGVYANLLNANVAGKRVASSGSGFRKSYTYVDAYACSNELDGVAWTENRNSSKIVGVGTFIHEFSHLLGLGDHYSKESNLYTLSYWDVMDAGAYNYASRSAGISSAPPYYSAFEREYMGWMKASEIEEGDGIELQPIQKNTAIKVKNPKKSDEFYLLEYRNRSKWDVGLPNHGMLIWHIDYNDTAWYNAEINTSKRMRVDIVEADGVADNNTVISDVFPGFTGFVSMGYYAKAVTSFNKFVTWAGEDLGVEITDIVEAKDYSKISFNMKHNGSYINPEVSSSSDAIAVSSSSGVPMESSSSEETLESSSSSEEMAVSSSSEVPQESSSSEEALLVRHEILQGVKVSRENGILAISGLPQGAKTLRVFSVNGNLLLSQPVVDGSVSLNKASSLGNIPVIVKVDSFVQIRF